MALGRRGKRMVDIAPGETSGVDHPAHFAEGWAIMKAAEGATSATDLVDRLKAEGLEVEKMAPAALASMLSEAAKSLPDNAQGPAQALIAALGGTTKEAGDMPEGTGTGGDTPTLQEQVTTLAAQVGDLTSALDTAKAATTEAETARKAAEAKLELATKAIGGAEEPSTPEAALKAAMATLPEPVRKAWEEDRARLAKAEKMAQDERDARMSAHYSEVAKSLNGVPAAPDALATLLREADEKLTKAASEELGRILKAVQAQVTEGALLFKEIGSAGGGGGGSALSRLQEAAKAIQTAGAGSGNDMTMEQALVKAADLNPELVAEYQREMAASARDGR